MTWQRRPKVSPAPGDFVGQTAAAAIAEMSLGHFCRLVKAGLGPTAVTTEDGKDGYDPTEVRKWGQLKHWRSNEHKGGRKRVGTTSIRVHLILDAKVFEKLKKQAARRKLPVSALIREKLK